MASEEQSQLSVSWPGLIALLVAVVGLFVSHPPLTSPRPSAVGGDGKDMVSDNSVPARLWQDPLTATRRGPEREGDNLALVVNDVPPAAREDANKPVLFLFDCIDPDSTPEDRENRRRERYAILSALSTAGYAPVQPDRIHYISIPPAPGAGAERVRGDGKTASKKNADEVRIPYEWVQPSRDHQTGGEETTRQYQAVCVLWVSMLPRPYQQLPFLHRLRQEVCRAWVLSYLRARAVGLFGHFGGEGLLLLSSAFFPRKATDFPPCKFAIAGRIGTTDLKDMLEHEADFNDKGGEAIPLYVTFSTSPFVRSLKPKAKGLAVEYFIDTDKRLVSSLHKELKRRHIDPQEEGDGNPIAVIAERDTDYGREMLHLFETLIQRNVHSYSYLRGLDGKVLGQRNEKSKGEEAADSGSDLPSVPKSAAKPTAQEGEGESQIDYVRRLAGRMKADGNNFKAIAIVGNDVYDKLLLLRALRPNFPNAVFCTTDLDVRLIQRGNYEDTRNILIAAPYGLCLRSELQGKVAPFRSSYDTASYLGCLRAVGYRPLEKYVSLEESGDGAKRLVPKAIPDKALPIHLYEMARSSGAYELTLFDTQTEDTIGLENPRHTPWPMRDHRFLFLLAVLVLVGLLLLPVSLSWQRFLRWLATPATRLVGRRDPETPPGEETAAWRYWLVLVAIFLGLSLSIFIYLAHIRGDQEPFELFEGISIWPTVVLHLLASWLCVYYIARACRELSTRNEEVCAKFDLHLPDTKYPGRGLRGHWLALRKSWLAWFRQTPRVSQVSKLHKKFAKRGALWQRAWRSGLLAFLNLLLFVLIWRTFNPTVIQARGEIAYRCYHVILFVSLIALAGLLMFVVDSTLLSYRFVSAFMRQRERVWPNGLVDKTAQKWGPLPSDPVAVANLRQAAKQWLYIRYIDAVTNVVARMIYYPFVVLLVLIVARNRLFDDWNWNIPLVLVTLFNSGAAVACAVMLQLEAKRGRDDALDALDKQLQERTGRQEDSLREKLNQIRAEIKHLHTGAFASFAQNPVVKAILLPLFGGGGLAALEGLLSLLQP